MHEVIPLQAPVDPVDALRRIAFLLERSGGGTYRVEAFRKAAAALRALPSGEVVRRAQAGTLTEVATVGASSATIVEQAVAGQLPDYLATLQEAAQAPLAAGGAQIYAALRGDLHCHSDWSDGGSPIDEMVLAAVDLGQQWLALTDHSPRLKVAHGLSAARLAQQIQVIDTLDAAVGDQLHLLRGIEVDINDDGSLDQTDELLGRLDVVTASVHSKLRAAGPAMTSRMLTAVRNPFVNVLGHCTGRLVQGSRGTRPPSDFDARAVFEACTEHDVAVEINSRPERCDPPDELIDLALDIGCLFAIDSDAHAPGQLDMKRYGCARAQEHGIPLERIVTTWPVDQVREWASRKR